MSSTDFFSTYFLPFSYSFMFPCDKISFLLYLRNLSTEQHLNEIDGKACVSPCQMVTLHAIAQTKLKDFVSNFISSIEVVGDVSLCNWGVSPTHFPISPNNLVSHCQQKNGNCGIFTCFHFQHSFDVQLKPAFTHYL